MVLTPPSSSRELSTTYSPTISTSNELGSASSESSSLSHLEWIDFELLHHYTSTTFKTIDDRVCNLDLWQKTVPRLALGYPFLMHILLSVSAAHLAYLQPHRLRELTLIISERQDRALPVFRAALTAPTEENCHALFVCSKLVAVHAFAYCRSRREESNQPGTIGNEVYEWFQLIRGGCSYFFSVYKTLEAGPVSSLGLQMDGPLNEEFDKYHKQLVTLYPLLRSARLSTQQREIYCTALDDLRNSFVAAFTMGPRSSVRETAYHWPSTISPILLNHLCVDHEPEALVLLAHYCVLLKRDDACWFLQGHAAWLMEYIQQHLDEEWKDWISWPMQEICGCCSDGQQECIESV